MKSKLLVLNFLDITPVIPPKQKKSTLSVETYGYRLSITNSNVKSVSSKSSKTDIKLGDPVLEKKEKEIVPVSNLPPKPKPSNELAKTKKLLWDETRKTVVFENSEGKLEPYYKEKIINDIKEVKNKNSNQSELK